MWKQSRETTVRQLETTTADDPLGIESVEDFLEIHSRGVPLKQSVSVETYNRRTQLERTNDVVTDYGLPILRSRLLKNCSFPTVFGSPSAIGFLTGSVLVSERASAVELVTRSVAQSACSW